MQEFAPYLQQAFDRLSAALHRLTDDEINIAPYGPSTMSMTNLVVHCCGVSEFWLGHVALGRPTERDRAAEFTATSTVAELEALIERSASQAVADAERLAGGPGEPSDWRAGVIAGGTDAAVVLHVIEELYQHVGHAEITADIAENRR